MCQAALHPAADLHLLAAAVSQSAGTGHTALRTHVPSFKPQLRTAGTHLLYLQSGSLMR